MIYAGRPRTEVNVEDLSVLLSGGIKGIAAILAETERGEFNKPQLIRNWQEFRKYFGEVGSSWVTPNATLSPFLVKRALEAGATLKVSRVEHYTDIEDNTTGTSVKGTATNSGVIFTLAQFGEFSAKITIALAASGTNDMVDITIEIVGFTKLTKVYYDVPLVISTALAATISEALVHCLLPAGTISMVDSIVATGGYANGTAATFDTFTWATLILTLDAATTVSHCYSVDTFDLVKGETYTFEYTVDSGAIAGYTVELVTAKDGTELVKSNSVSLTATSGKLYLKVTDDVTDAYLRISSTVASGAVVLSAIVLTKLKDSVEVAFSSGSYASASLVNADFIGHADSETGIHSFGNETDIWRIAIPHKAIPEIDIALANYAALRKDMRAILRTPVGLNAEGIRDYRNGVGIYSHVKINTHFASMFTGGLRIINPVTLLEEEIPEIQDILGLKAGRDNKDNYDYKPWFASAGPKYPVQNVLGVVFNLNSPARTLDFDDVSNAGVNAVVVDPTYGVIPKDNRTLQVADTMLKHENVSELVVYMMRNIKALANSVQFDPNDVITWKTIWRKITPFLDGLVTGRAIQVGYLYQGDQDVDKIADATINEQEDIDAGGYVANIYFKPIAALKYIGIGLNLTSSSVNLVELAERLNA